jgi:hypothetical protein
MSRSRHVCRRTLEKDGFTMRTLRLWLLLLLLPLITPMAWAQVDAAVLRAEPPCPLHQAMARAEATTSMGHAAQRADDAAVHAPPAATQRPPARHLPCGDCSACHAVALLPPAWQIDGPELVEAAPGWHADLGPGRPDGCELYRPPRA